MNDGIFKTTRTGLVGATRMDFQWFQSVTERAQRKAKACRPQGDTEDEINPGRQLCLPWGKQPKSPNRG